MIDTTKSISKVTYDGTNMSLATQTKTVTPTTSKQVIVGDDGYNLSSVTVEAVTKDIDTNIQPNNIKQGVSILGVKGVLDGNKLPDVLNKTVTSLTAGDLIGVTQIPIYAFQNCIDLTSVEFSSTLQTIYSYAFSGCSSLTSIDFGENSQLTSIGPYAFEGCSSLTSISLPSSVTSIGYYAFRNCTSLTTMRIEATTPPTLSSTNAISTATTRIEVPMASVDAYKAATNWSNFADIIVGYTE